MTYEEAIRHFKSLQKRYTTEHNGKMCEKVALALGAMEKQIPKKLVATDWYKVRDGVEWKDWKCPTCGSVLWRKELTDEYCKPLTYTMQHHCICGQNIDNG